MGDAGVSLFLFRTHNLGRRIACRRTVFKPTI
jgi:hypothetical protein